MSGSGASSIALTAEQQAPISAREASVALAAGAGCGKTKVLTEKFVALLDGQAPPPLDRIVALTFTEKAARELRGRIRTACREKAERGTDTAYWRGVLRDLEIARIGTFHAFCGTILRRYPIEAAVDPSFAVLDDAIAPTVRGDSLDACLRRWLSSRDPDLAALAVDYGLDAVREALGDFLANRPDLDLDVWASTPPSEIVSSWERFRDGPALASLLSGMAPDHRELLEVLSGNECSHPVMSDRRAMILADLPRLHLAANPAAAMAELREFAKVQGGGKKDHWPSAEVYEEVKKRLTYLRGHIDTLLKLLAPDDGRSLAAAEAGVRFARLASQAVAEYSRAKAQEGVLDFDDLQSRVRDLLRHGPVAVREDLVRSIDILLVDEFQDTDATQAEILSHLAGAEIGGGRLFLVGDAKQSIYRFRGARPEIFDRFRKDFPPTGRLNLTENFRSVPGILAFVNALFGETFPGREHLLRPGGPPSGLDAEAAPAVEFLWSGAPGARTDAASRRKAEAAAIARMLSARLAAGWTVRVRGERESRAARPGDVAILFRSRSDFPLYEHALASEGLDYHVVGGSTFFAQQEVIDLINLLSAIEDPFDPLALAGTLRGPVFGVSDEGLFWLATAGTGDLPSAFQRWERVAESLAPDDRTAIGRAHVLLSRWRGEKDRLSIAGLLNLALVDSGFEAALLGEFLGERKRANVRKLVRLARKFDQRGSFTLADFVARLRADVKNPPREEQATTTDDRGRAVRLMTIHQAKGLEFPIVIVADLDRDTPNTSKLMSYHPELGVLVRATGTDPDDELPTRNLGRLLRDRIESRAEHEEALRVFYVAATRARDALVLSAGISPDDPPASPALTLLAERFHLADGTCRVGEVDPERPPRAAVIADSADLPPGNASRTPFRPRILMTARRITRASPPFEEDGARSGTSRQRWLSLDTSSVLTGAMPEVDRLLRAALTDPSAIGDVPLPDLVERIARSQGLWTSDRVHSLACRLLDQWRSSRVFRAVARADQVRRAIRWTVAWPPDDPSATVYSGRIDLACRNANGAWNLVNIALEAGDEVRSRETLNLQLSAFASGAHAIGPVSAGWLVTLGPRLTETRIDSIDEDEIRRSLRVLS